MRILSVGIVRASDDSCNNAPFIDERDVEQLVRDILDARQALDAAAPE